MEKKAKKEAKKKGKLRHAEYYDFQTVLDQLYSRSVNGENFYKLVDLMKDEHNIKLAYRNIKSNKGSKTPGTDGLTIKDIKNIPLEEVISTIQEMFDWYVPKSIRRVHIPKEGGNGVRPLGIPTIWDRLFQQCILQILEPIAEAKFHNHSYGFRPNRSTKHAIARTIKFVNFNLLHYCIDVDIKGFFDNVNHGKLLKQMWTLGIRDKSLLSMISKILKSEIVGEGIPTKGTPQGGIISPILSNIVLNELDWWVSDQWETFVTNHQYATNESKYRALKKDSNMKEMFIVRYADDFKIFCRNYTVAQRVFQAVEDFLKKRLQLDISPEKSKIINLRKKGSSFLGIRIKALPKGTTCTKGKKKTKFVAKSHMTKKAKDKAFKNLKLEYKKLKSDPSPTSVNNYNSVVRGIQNYYSMATEISRDLSELNFLLRRTRFNKLHKNWTEAKFDDLTTPMKKRYKDYRKGKLYKIDNAVLLPLHAQKHVKVMNFSQEINNYTVKGREKLHDNLICVSEDTLRNVMRSYSPNRSMEYNDNRISKFVAQYGNCAITGIELNSDEVHCHHIIPYSISQDDSYGNLIIVHKYIHYLIHMVDEKEIISRITQYNLNAKQVEKLNWLRAKARRKPIKLTS